MDLYNRERGVLKSGESRQCRKFGVGEMRGKRSYPYLVVSNAVNLGSVRITGNSDDRINDSLPNYRILSILQSSLGCVSVSYHLQDGFAPIMPLYFPIDYRVCCRLPLAFINLSRNQKMLAHPLIWSIKDYPSVSIAIPRSYS